MGHSSKGSCVSPTDRSHNKSSNSDENEKPVNNQSAYMKKQKTINQDIKVIQENDEESIQTDSESDSEEQT